jgi:hypothetical protein
MYLLICCGLIVGIGYYILATKAQLKLYEQRKTVEILFFTVFAIYAVLEQGPFNPILNPFVLVIGNLIYREQSVNLGNTERIQNNGSEKKTADLTSA